MYKRWQEKNIKSALKTRKVVILSGSRQCGKTTTSKDLTNKESLYRTLDDITLLQAAKNDPQGFIKLNKGTMILDEVQRVPELITAIKKTVDENTRYEEYLKINPNDLEVRYDKNFAEILAKKQ